MRGVVWYFYLLKEKKSVLQFQEQRVENFTVLVGAQFPLFIPHVFLYFKKTKQQQQEV